MPRLPLILLAAALLASASASGQTTGAEEAQMLARSHALAGPEREAARHLFDAAFRAWQTGQFVRAASLFREGLGVDPADPAANYYAADCWNRLGAKALALDLDRRAVAFGAGGEFARLARIAIARMAVGADDGAALVPLGRQ